MRQTPIVINGRFLTQGVTGVQRFAREIVRAIDSGLVHYPSLASRAWIICAPIGTCYELATPHISFQTSGRSAGHLWEQTDLFRASRNSLLVNLANSGPVLHRNSVTILHDAMVFSTPHNFSYTYGLLHRTLGRILAHGGHIGTVSEFSASEINKYLAVRPSLILPNGCDHLSRIEPDAGVCDRLGIRRYEYLLFVGSKAPNKNLSLVLEAIRRLGSRAPKLVVVGATDTRVLRNKECCGDEAVLFAQRLSDEEVCGLYRSALALVFPSKYEGFGIPPLEAMSLDCLALVSDIPPTREVCGEAALYFDCTSPESLGHCILRLSEDPKLRAELIRRGRQRAQNYNWQSTADILLQYLERMPCM